MSIVMKLKASLYCVNHSFSCCQKTILWPNTSEFLVKALDGIDFIIPAAEQSETLHQTILEFAKAHNVEFNIVQKADNILFNINAIGLGLGCTILPGYVAPLSMNNTVIRPLEVELPYLDLYVNYRKNNSCTGSD